MILTDELESVRAAIRIEREAERRGTTRHSRLPGLLAEEERLLQAIALAGEPDDLALHIARKIFHSTDRTVVGLARLIRGELK